MQILSMDVGLINMGLVFADVDIENRKLLNIIDCRRVDIRSLCNFCTDKECKHGHSKCIADYMSHLFSEFDYFVKADLILIERHQIMYTAC